MLRLRLRGKLITGRLGIGLNTLGDIPQLEIKFSHSHTPLALSVSD